jgi:hypothetical protein
MKCSSLAVLPLRYRRASASVVDSWVCQEQLVHRIVRDQTLAVFGEDRGHPDAVVQGLAYEPAKQQVVLGLLHQQALGAHAVEDSHHHGSEQLLRRNAGPTTLDSGGIIA